MALKKQNLVIARVRYHCSYEDHSESLELVKHLDNWQPYCYIGIPGEMRCSGRIADDKIHPRCAECYLWKDYNLDQ